MPRTDPSGPLERYARKRNFKVTSEPKAVRARTGKRLGFVIQKHWASRLHYDFRLELDGVLLSWAVPKGPSCDPKDKRMAIQVEDHPVRYGRFEGTIPAGQYGAGTVIVWDNGHWEPVGDPHEGLARGKLVFALHGQKLAGLWELVRTSKPGARQDQWLLFKKKDDWARPRDDYDVITALPDSVMETPLECQQRQEFVVCGYTDRSNATAEVGSLLWAITRAASCGSQAASVRVGPTRRGGAMYKATAKAARRHAAFRATQHPLQALVAPCSRERTLGQAVAGGRGRVR